MLLTTILAVETEGIELFPDESELIWGLVAFLLLMGVMFKLVFPKLNETLEQRSAAIQGRMEEAQHQLEEAEASKRRYDESLDDARGEANRIIEEAKSTADQVRAEARTRAEAEAAQIIERAQAEVAAERDRVLQELRSQVGDISVQLASKIVERELDRSTHEGLVDEYIQRLSSQN
jgi:F-type H+-transporting ATPase subunit b